MDCCRHLRFFQSSINSARFNPFIGPDGTDEFEISAFDTLRITNDATGLGASVFATVDAIKLERVGNAAALTTTLLGADSLALGRLDTASIALVVASVNTGVTAVNATIILDIPGQVAQTLGTIALNNSGADTLLFAQPIASLGAFTNGRIQIIVRDNLGREVQQTVLLTVLPDLEIFFVPNNAERYELPVELPFERAVRLQTLVAGEGADTLYVYQQASGGSETLVDGPMNIAFPLDTYLIVGTLNVPVGDSLRYRFLVNGVGGRSFTRALTLVATEAAPSVSIDNRENLPFYQPQASTLVVDLRMDSRRPSVPLQNIRAFASINGQAETLFFEQPLNTANVSLGVPYSVAEEAQTNISLRFEVSTQLGLMAETNYAFQVAPRRGDLRMAVVSDFNAAFGAVTYEWQVDSIIQRIPRLWNPDLVVCGGDMIAGQSEALTPEQVDAMWAGFETSIAAPIRAAGIPFVFTLGNHDGAIAVDRQAAERYWRVPEHFPGWFPLDTTNYPFYMSFLDRPGGESFFIAWNASDANLSTQELAWVEAQLQSPAAQGAKFRFVVGHLPLYASANERNSIGNILNNAEQLRALLERYNVHTYVSGHHHAYFPGKRGDLELMNAGAAGSGPRSLIGRSETSPNTVTLMDVYYAENPAFGKDTIVYTTYETRFLVASEMPLLNERTLPEVIFTYNGQYQLRRDVEVMAETTGRLSALHLPVAETPAQGLGTVVTTRTTGGSLLVSGSFSNLRGRILPEPGAVALFLGRHGENGSYVTDLEVNTTDGRSGTFRAQLPASPEVQELLTVGSYYVVLSTDRFPASELRAQLYPAANQAPLAPLFTDQFDTVNIRNEPAVLVQQWSRSNDPESNPVTYIYQAATDPAFNNLLIHRGTGSETRLIIEESELYRLIATQNQGSSLNLYRRVVATDGREQTTTVLSNLVLRQSEVPIVGDITLPAPDYRYDCTQGQDEFTRQCNGPVFPTGFANGHGVAVDGHGRIWAAAFSGGLRVVNPDGSDYLLSSDKITYSTASRPFVLNFRWKNTTVDARNIRGLGADRDGNILIAVQNSDLYKFDALTGEPLAFWDGPTSLTNPSVDSLGRIFFASVTGNSNFLLQQQQDTFVQLVPTFTLSNRPSVVRAAAISFDGKMIFLPSNGDPNVRRYTSSDGLVFSYQDTVATTNSSNSIFTAPGGKMYVLVNRGQSPAKVVFRDFATPGRVLSWELSLEEILPTDLRGLAFTSNLDTFYLVSSTNGAVERYLRNTSGTGGSEV
ncbi:MAG: CHRD domain-containing protein, partial [Lewinella sp.]|nr:CHRD domain-containing protein [Lewinella sp.]